PQALRRQTNRGPGRPGGAPPIAKGQATKKRGKVRARWRVPQAAAIAAPRKSRSERAAPRRQAATAVRLVWGQELPPQTVPSQSLQRSIAEQQGNTRAGRWHIARFLARE